MVTLAEKYKDIPDCGAGPRFAYSTWPSASRNEQRSSTNDQHEGRIVDAVVSLCRGGENIYSIPVVQSSESAYTFVSSCLRGENQFYTPGSQLPSPVTACSYDARGYAISVTYPQGANGLPAGTTNYIYYDSQWQVLEVRTGGTAASNVTEQMVWSAAYINAAVLQVRMPNVIGLLRFQQIMRFDASGFLHCWPGLYGGVSGAIVERNLILGIYGQAVAGFVVEQYPIGNRHDKKGEKGGGKEAENQGPGQTGKNRIG